MEHPVLVWKPNNLHCKASLKKDTLAHYMSLTALSAAVVSRLKKTVFLITRTRTHNNTSAGPSLSSSPQGPGSAQWTIFAYKSHAIPCCKIPFKHLRIDGLPLGGNPLTPSTYLIGTDGNIGEVAYGRGGYFLREAALPGEDPEGMWVESYVPTELQNDGESLKWTPGMHFAPSIEELAQVMAWAEGMLPQDTKVKAGGARHSWSEVGVTDGVYIAPEGLKMLSMVGQDRDPDIYRVGVGKGLLVRGGTGNTVREVNGFAWKRGLAFATLGGYDGQTLGGVFNTGTHGSVFKNSHLAEAIVSMDLVLFDGKVVRIEPKDGITDPKAFSKHFPNTKLIQEDDTFDAALINMGTMGVVRTYVLKLTPKFHLKEVRTVSTISEVKQKLRDGKIDSLAGVDGIASEIAKQTMYTSTGQDGGFKYHPMPAYHLELLFNPHGERVIVTSRHPIVVEDADDREMEFHPSGRDLIRTIEHDARFSRPAGPTWLLEQFSQLVTCLLNTLITFLPRTVPHLIDSSMDTLLDEAYIDRSFNVFNIGPGANQIPALSCTIYIPVEKDMHLQALDTILTTAKDKAEKGMYETAPVSMRFLRKSRALLGVPKDSCAFELIFTAGTKYAQEVVDGYDAVLRERFGDEVRVHWGQMMGRGSEGRVSGMYPGYKGWRAVRDRLDPRGRFLSKWQKETLPEVVPQV